MNIQRIIVKDCSDISVNMTLINDYVEFMRETLSAKKVFIVHGKHSYYDCGAATFMTDVQSLAKCDYHDFSSFSNNPKSEDVEFGVNEAKQYKPDVIVAIGGGSVLDMAKLVRFYSQMQIQLVAIPTTAGTGAESTQFAVCYFDGEKRSISSPEILPDIVMLNPQWTMTNNQYLTVCTGFDALAQAVEAYWNINATEESDIYATEALSSLINCMVQLSDDAHACMSSKIWREQMMIGANLAGQAINITRTTAPHAMSYKLTSEYGYPHGHAVALTFPFFAKLNIECPKELYIGDNYENYMNKMKLLKHNFGISNKDVESFFRTLILKLGLNYKMESEVDAKIIAGSINLERAKNNPHILTNNIVKQAAQSIYKNIQ